MEDVVLEVAAVEDITCYVDSFSIASAAFDLPLVVVAVSINEATITVGQACCEATLIQASRRIVVPAKSLGTTVVPFSLVDHSRPRKLIEAVGLQDSPFSPCPTKTLLLHRA